MTDLSDTDRPDPDRPDWDEARLTAWLVERVAEACFIDPDEVDVHRLVNDFGLSSRDAVGLSGELEQLLDVELPATLFWENPTIAGLVAKLSPGAAPEPVRTDRRRRSSDGPIAIVGVGCRFPGGADSPAAYWRLLTGGVDAVGEVPADRWAGFDGRPEALDGVPRHGGYLGDIAGFDAEFFGITPREARLMDPQQRMVLEVAWEALADAGIAPDSLQGSPTGVYVGISSQDYGRLTVGLEAEAWSATGASASISANRLSYALDLRGPSVTVDTACSSSLVAVHQACQALRLGEISAALVGGANALISPTSTAAMNALGVLSATGRCRPFAATADGITRAEGCGMLVLKRLVDAQRDGDRVLALIRGSAVNSDGRSNGLTAPNPDAQRELLEAAYAVAGVDPGEVDYVEAHGGGTLLGDPIEAGALGSVLGAGRHPERPLLIGSVKSNFGSLEAAGGVAGLIKVVLAMRAGQVPPSLHSAELSPHIPFDRSRLRVVAEPTEWPRYGRMARAGVSAFGFGGTNAHVVLEEVPEAPIAVPPLPRAGGPVRPTEPVPSVVVLSAATEDRLRRASGHLASWAAKTDETVADVAHTLARRHLPGRWRAAVVAASMAEAAAGLRQVAQGREGSARVVVGAVGREPHHAVWVLPGAGGEWAGMGRGLLRTDETFAAAVDELGDPFTAHAGVSLRTLLESAGPGAPEVAGLTVFGTQLALARMWRSYGVEPAAVIGHSTGRVAAAVLAGALTTEQGVRVMAPTAGSGALPVQPSPGGLSTPVYDTVGDDPRGTPLFDATYWAAVDRGPGRFVAAVGAAADDGHTTFLELSPHPVLLDDVSRALADRDQGATVVASMRDDEPESVTVAAALAALHCAGVEVDWTRAAAARRRPGRVVSVPSAPWHHRRHWVEPAGRPDAPGATASADLTSRVQEIVASISGHLPRQVATDVSLADLGLDSLMAARIRNVLAAEFGSVPQLRDIQRGITVEEIVAELGADAVVAVPVVGPRDATERMLARLWAAELGVTPDSVNADFLALGGTDEHAARLTARLTREVGHRFVIDDVLARPVLHEMAGLVRQHVDGDDLTEPIRTLRERSGVGGRPLHLFHPAGGPTSVYRPLVDRLPDDVPCYGLERDREDGVAARVGRHLELIRRVQPEGPYRLAGWSFGGSLAFEAACQLRAAGAEVELVALIDTVRPGPPEGGDRRLFSARRLLLLVSQIEQTYGKDVVLDRGALPGMEEMQQIETVVAALGDARLGMPEAVLRHQRTSIVDAYVGERFAPGHFDGRVVLYRATEVFPGIAALDPRYAEADPDGGWSGHCGGLEVVPVRGDHLSVIDPPLVDAIADDLAARLTRHAVGGLLQ